MRRKGEGEKREGGRRFLGRDRLRQGRENEGGEMEGGKDQILNICYKIVSCLRPKKTFCAFFS